MNVEAIYEVIKHGAFAFYVLTFVSLIVGIISEITGEVNTEYLYYASKIFFIIASFFTFTLAVVFYTHLLDEQFLNFN